MPNLDYGVTFLETGVNNVKAHSWDDVLVPFQKVRTLLNTTGLDTTNIQANGLEPSDLRADTGLLGVRLQVYNSTGSTLTAGTLVYLKDSTTVGGESFPNAIKAISTSNTATTYFAQACVEADISDNTAGTVALFVQRTGINTSSASVGDPVYLDTTAGGYTFTRPTGGNLVQVVGVVIEDHASTGKINFFLASFPDKDPTDTLSELGDINLTSPADGSMLLYDTGTSKWIDNVMSGDATMADTGAVTLAGTNTNLTSLANLVTVGTIGTGTWAATDVAVAHGGTGASSASDARTNLGLVIGTNVQAYDAGLNSIAGLTTAANKMIYTSGSDTYAVADLSTFARTILDDADAAAVRTTIGAGTSSVAAFTDLSDVGSTSATAGKIMVADGDSWESVAVSGDIALASSGAMTIQANSVALGTDTTGNYVATVADAGNSHITVANSGSENAAVTLNITDNAVGLAQMAGLARGKIIVGDSSGNPSALSVGSNGQVLTVDSNGDAVWSAAASGGVDAANGADNRIATFTDSDSLNGEANLRYDGSKLEFGAAATVSSSADGFVLNDGSNAGMTIHSTGTSSGQAKIALNNANGADDGAALIYSNSNNKFFINSNGAVERFSIDANGFTTITNSTSSTPYGLYLYGSGGNPNNTTVFFLKCESSTETKAFIYSNGSFQSRANSYGGISDIKTKQDITNARSYWNDFAQVKFRKFKFKSDVAEYGDNAPSMLGVIAQEIETIFPDLVSESPDTKRQEVPILDAEGNDTGETEEKDVDLGTTTKSVKYSILNQIGLKVIQELQTRLEAAETKIAALEAA